MPLPVLIAAFLALDFLLGIAVGRFLGGPGDLPFADPDLDSYEAARRNPKGRTI